MKNRILLHCAVVAAAAVVAACSEKKAPTAPTPPPVATVTAPRLDAPADNVQLDTLRPTLTVTNATSDQATGARTYEFQISDSTTFSAATTASSIAGFDAQVGKTGVTEGADGKTSYTLESDLQPTTVFYWRARAIQGAATGPWSDTFKFKSKLVGFNRAGELYDPLIHGETVGTIVGSATFVPGKGLRINDGQSHVRYLLPATIRSGEFSMDVEGLRANGPGDKTKVFGMQEGQDDFITNKFRVDIQYRGSAGYPPNAITFRALNGDSGDLDVRYEPDTATRMASVFLLNPANVYHWKAVWGSGEWRVNVRDGGTSGTMFYNVGVRALNGNYTPSPHYAYLGAPVGRSGGESASIPGATYRNVWLSDRPRPDTLGSALR